MKAVLSYVIMLSFAPGLWAAETHSAEVGTNQLVKQFEFKAKGTQRLSYLLFLPQGYAESEQRWPLILFLHGAGERGADISKVTIHGPPKRVKAHPDFPFILVSPQCPEEEIWSRDILLGLLEEVMKNNKVDATRVYLTGLSMGGYGTWDLGMSHPEKFAAIVPICGGGDYLTMLLAAREKPEVLRTLGIWAFHGAKDPVVPVSESERMLDFARKQGVKDVKLTVYPEALHDSWTQTYDNPELYTWMLEHRRAGGGVK
jgi:predicted peptidase